MSGEATRLPWRTVSALRPRAILDADGIRIATGETNEVTALIVAAVNSHDGLIETLSLIADFAVGHGDVCEIIAQRARAALAAAEGRTP